VRVPVTQEIVFLDQTNDLPGEGGRIGRSLRVCSPMLVSLRA
jgi:hypothetical protein